ncbi:MAG: hypothetical protein H8D63_03140 [Parcubacteria group bacterium]|nr:hypothetical protein [Parcubacteria group bacterium]
MIIAILLFSFWISVNVVYGADSASIYKWSGTSVGVDVSDLPSGWIPSLASSMTAWNNISSTFTFYSSSGGHKVYDANIGPGVPGETYLSKSGVVIQDADTVLNTNYLWSTSGVYGHMDVQNVLTHELGHWFMLYDLYYGYQSEYTMYGVIVTGETKKRTLEDDDVDSAYTMYH